jgi:hypothetical protein
MPDTAYELHGVRVFECAAEGPQPRNDRDAVELISAARSERASVIVIPAERLGDDFFQLKTRIAGEILQKMVTYHLIVAILGEIARHLSENSALRDFVYECNRGSQIWFVRDREDLERQLLAHPPES